MMISPFSLPSNPEKKITLREATVGDAIDFADVAEDHEEELTTLFLNRLQDKATFIDAKTWTAEDRRFALYWYWLHTTKDTEIALTYECGHCGKTHTFLQDFRKLAEAYTPIKGLPERDIEWEGERITVRPLTGIDMEILQNRTIVLRSIAGDQGETSGAYRKQAAMLRIERLLMHIDFAVDASREDSAKRYEARRRRIIGLTTEKFSSLADLVFTTLNDLRHGLEMEYADGSLNLIMPPHICPEKGGETRLRVPFRNSDYIPGL